MGKFTPDSLSTYHLVKYAEFFLFPERRVFIARRDAIGVLECQVTKSTDVSRPIVYKHDSSGIGLASLSGCSPVHTSWSVLNK